MGTSGHIKYADPICQITVYRPKLGSKSSLSPSLLLHTHTHTFTLSLIFQELADEKFYESTEESEEEDSEEDEDEDSETEGKRKKKKSKRKPYVMDADHRLLLRVTKSLLQSRNSAVRHTLSIYLSIYLSIFLSSYLPIFLSSVYLFCVSV